MDRFKLMETYVTVVRQGSYTRAADMLGVTRAMVSKRMQDLEETLGARLLDRNTHGVSVTAAGAEYYESCVSLISELRAVEERASAERAVPRGELRILATKTFGEMVLAPVIADFCCLYPEVTVDVTLADRTRDVVPGGYDLAIRTLPLRDSALVARPIVSLPRILVAAPDYLSRNGRPRNPADLVRYNCLDPSGAAHNRWEFRARDGRKVVRVSGAPRANTSSVVRQAALKGLGIAILREYLVHEDLTKGSLVRILGEYDLDKRALYTVYRKDHHLPMRVRVFIDYLAHRMKSYGKEGAITV